MRNEKITVEMDESLLLVADLLARALDLSRDEVVTLVLKQYIDHDPDCQRAIKAAIDEAYGDDSLSYQEEQFLESQHWDYIRRQTTEAR
jgi:hypothetical protein